MPGEDRKLTKADIEKAKAWLLEHGTTEACPFCHNTNWSVNDILVLAPQYRKDGVSPELGVPCVIVVCPQCAFLRFHSAIMMGIIELDKTAEQKEATSG